MHFLPKIREGEGGLTRYMYGVKASLILSYEMLMKNQTLTRLDILNSIFKYCLLLHSQNKSYLFLRLVASFFFSFITLSFLLL